MNELEKGCLKLVKFLEKPRAVSTFALLIAGIVMWNTCLDAFWIGCLRISQADPGGALGQFLYLILVASTLYQLYRQATRKEPGDDDVCSDHSIERSRCGCAGLSGKRAKK